jgi:tripartite-type tricarboxylate transporter receptor subunit TctC
MRALLSGIAFAVCLAAGAAQAEWPERPVKLVLPFAPGGGADAIARPYAEGLSKALGQQFVVESRGGAGGAIGFEAVIKSPPDGYTVLFGHSAGLTMLPHLRSVPYRIDELIPVARLGTQVGALVAHPDLKVKTMAELVARAKQEPGKISSGVAGIGTAGHIRLEVLKRSAAIDILVVPYRGNGDLTNDLLAGVVQVATGNNFGPFLKAGKLVALAMTSDRRLPDFPDVPTVAEAGYPDVNVPFWYGAFLPPGTPQAIVTRLHDAIAALAMTPDMKEKLLQVGFVTSADTAAELAAAIRRENESLGKVIREAGIKGE